MKKLILPLSLVGLAAANVSNAAANFTYTSIPQASGCFNLMITNTGSEGGVWKINLSLPRGQTLDHSWNMVVNPSSSNEFILEPDLNISNVHYLASGQSTPAHENGYCVKSTGVGANTGSETVYFVDEDEDGFLNIQSTPELRAINYLQCSDLGDIKGFELDRDLVLDGLAWVPLKGCIENGENTPFNYLFNGGNHSISGITVKNTTQHQGFIETADGAEIRDLTLTNVHVETTDNRAGGVVGNMQNTKIINVHVSGYIKGKLEVGGIAGRGYSTGNDSGNTIVRSSFEGVVDGDSRIGGLAGSYAGEIVQSFSQCRLDATQVGTDNKDEMGGLVGMSGFVRIHNSFAACGLIGERRQGGLIGRVNDQSKTINVDIVNSYAVSSFESGIANESLSTRDLGGLIGKVESKVALTIDSSYSNAIFIGSGSVPVVGVSHAKTSKLINNTSPVAGTFLKFCDTSGTTCADTIYTDWPNIGADEVSGWDFGASHEYPGLMFNNRVMRASEKKLLVTSKLTSVTNNGYCAELQVRNTGIADINDWRHALTIGHTDLFSANDLTIDTRLVEKSSGILNSVISYVPADRDNRSVMVSGSGTSGTRTINFAANDSTRVVMDNIIDAAVGTTSATLAPGATSKTKYCVTAPDPIGDFKSFSPCSETSGSHACVSFSNNSNIGWRAAKQTWGGKNLFDYFNVEKDQRLVQQKVDEAYQKYMTEGKFFKQFCQQLKPLHDDIDWNKDGIPDTGYKVCEGQFAYVQDSTAGEWGNNVIKSEGLSYAMMIALMRNDQNAFDDVWRFAKQFTQGVNPSYPNYFGWVIAAYNNSQANAFVPLDRNPASDGEAYYVTALLMASKKFTQPGHSISSDIGRINYATEAWTILNAMTASEDGMFNPDTPFGPLIVFSPVHSSYDITDASYHVPAFYETWIDIAGMENNRHLLELPAASRDYLVAAQTELGLYTERGEFTGEPLTGGLYNQYHWDSWRVVQNIAVDYYWYSQDPRLKEAALNVLRYFYEVRNPDTNRYCGEISYDGSERRECGKVGQMAMNAVGALVIDETDSEEIHEMGEHFVRDLWEATPPGDYYNGMLYMLGLLHASGQFTFDLTPYPSE